MLGTSCPPSRSYDQKVPLAAILATGKDSLIDRQTAPRVFQSHSQAVTILGFLVVLPGKLSLHGGGGLLVVVAHGADPEPPRIFKNLLQGPTMQVGKTSKGDFSLTFAQRSIGHPKPCLIS